MSSQEVNRFPHDVYLHRLTQVQQKLPAVGASAVVVSPGPLLQYLTGCVLSSHERLTALIISAENGIHFLAPSVDAADMRAGSALPEDAHFHAWNDGENPYAIVAEAIAADEQPLVLLNPTMEAAHVLALQAELGASARFDLATTCLSEVFIAKDDAEVATLTQVAAAIDAVHAKVPELLAPGVTEAAVAAQLEQLILREHVAVDFIIVGSGPNGANPHHSFSERVLENGDLVVVDIGGTDALGYHSDCTRTYVVGSADAADADALAMYAVLERAQQEAVQAIRPGVQASEIDAIARKTITDAGYGEFFTHRTGHGIGLSTHEEPNIMAGNSLVLEPNMTFSVEPGIYLPGKFGARIEDIVVVTTDGVRQLNQQPRHLVASADASAAPQG